LKTIMTKRLLNKILISKAAYIRTLMYPIIFCSRPKEHVSRVVEETLHIGIGEQSAEYLDAIERLLQTDKRLSTLLPQDHSEEVIREYLSAVADYLRKRV